MSYQIKRSFRRIYKSCFKPTSFLIEFKIENDILGPIIIGIAYFLAGFLFTKLRSLDIEVSLRSMIINGTLNLLEFILTPIILLVFISAYKVKIYYIRDFSLIGYTFSIKIIFYLIIFLLTIIFFYIIRSPLIDFIIQIIFVISITWSLTLQFYFLRIEKGIKSASLFILIFITWASILFFLSLVNIYLKRIGLV